MTSLLHFVTIVFAALASGQPAQSSRLVADDFSVIGRTPVERQERDGWKARKDTPPYKIVPDRLDWSYTPYPGDRNWIYNLHSWRPMDAYVSAYFRDGNLGAIHSAIAMALSWADFWQQQPPSERKWLNTLNGARSSRLAVIIEALRRGDIGLNVADEAKLYEIATHHAEWVQKPGNLSRMNHAFYELIGLEVLCRVMAERPACANAKEFVSREFRELIDRQFTPEGIHRENSPAYHYFAHLQAIRARSILTVADEDTKARIQRAGWALPWLAYPDGSLVAVGDSGGDMPVAFTDAGGHEIGGYAVAPFWRSGYAIVRSMPDTPVDQTSMLFMAGQSFTGTHAHADKLSFELMEFGRRILIDTGRYAYLKDAMRVYASSAAAHNTVDYVPASIGPADIELGATKLNEPRFEEDGSYVLSGSVLWSRSPYDFQHDRTLTYRPGQSLLIEDRVTSDTPKSYASRLHFEASIALERDGGSFTAEVDGREMRATLLDSDCEINVYRGSESPLRGWQTVDYGKMVPATTVEAVCEGATRTISWSITFR